MLPKNLVADKQATPKDFDSLVELAETEFRVEHEQTTLERLSLSPDGTLTTPQGEWQVTQDFLESCASMIGMPLGYGYRISSELFCENFAARQAESTAPVTICRVGDVATGLVKDGKARYRPARTGEVFRSLQGLQDLKFRRGTFSFAGVDAEFVRPGMIIEPAVGDAIEVGIALSNSETGDRQLKAAAYSYRLICTNGAVMADTIGVARWPNDPRMTPAACLHAFERQFSALCAGLDPVAALYRTATDRPVPDVAFWNLWRRVAYVVERSRADDVLGIVESERLDLQQVVRDRSRREPPAMTRWNTYDVHNRITHAAHGQRFRVRRSLQEIGGAFLSEAATWPVASLN